MKINYYKKRDNKRQLLAQVKNNCVFIDWKLGFAQVKNTLFADILCIFTVIAKVFPFKSLRKLQKCLSEIAFHWFSTNLLSMHFHIFYKRSLIENSFLFFSIQMWNQQMFDLKSNDLCSNIICDINPSKLHISTNSNS